MPGVARNTSRVRQDRLARQNGILFGQGASRSGYPGPGDDQGGVGTAG